MRCTEWFSGRGADEPPVRAPKQPPRPTVLAWKIWVLLVAVAIGVPLACSGCVAARYLTQEEDEKLRQLCERPGGCAVVPGNQWRAIQQFLERLGIKPEDPT